VRRDANHIALIWGSEKQKYFCNQGWTESKSTGGLICPSGSHIAASDAGAPSTMHLRTIPDNQYRLFGFVVKPRVSASKDFSRWALGDSDMAAGAFLVVSRALSAGNGNNESESLMAFG
jgi:hypothetical protein